ncbi:MAG: preprotein translocase subunit YajC [Oscillospiraceae bacterium]|jgi:preprotein translocase subunit YajC|nr:preprotein translocase subunit YajC [Oscillospiraceae bacterium]
MFLSALAATGSGEGSGGMLVMLVQMVPLILVFVVMYFIMIRPQKKKEKEVQAMRSGLQVGDEVITVGGIIGRVVSLRDDTVVIETGTDRSKLRILRTAVQTNNTIHDDSAEE